MTKVYEQMRDYTNWALGIGIAVGLFLLAKKGLIQLYRQEPIRGVLASVLLVTTAGRFYLYMQAVREELDLLATVFDENKISKPAGSPLLIAIMLAVAFGAMIAYCTNILIYTIIALPFTVIDVHGQATVNRNIGTYIFEGRESSKSTPEYRKALFDYYFCSPLMLRGAVMLALMAAALLLAAAEYFTANDLFGLGAYLVAILTSIIGEVAIARWRKRRDDALRAAPVQ